MTYAVAVVAAMVVVTVFNTWCLWRVLDRLGVLRRFEERLSSLTHTLALLTDITEGCFQAVVSQLQQDQSQKAAATVGRVARQRRMVGAARRGRSVPDIAADEEVAESEVRLRLHLAKQGRITEMERGSDGSMLP